VLYRRELAALKLTTTLSTRITGETSRSGCTAVWSSFAVPGGSLRRCRRMASLANYGAALHAAASAASSSWGSMGTTWRALPGDASAEGRAAYGRVARRRTAGPRAAPPR